eukprot:1177566-Pyramimonas_sp.AAC.1
MGTAATSPAPATAGGPPGSPASAVHPCRATRTRTAPDFASAAASSIPLLALSICAVAIPPSKI